MSEVNKSTWISAGSNLASDSVYSPPPLLRPAYGAVSAAEVSAEVESRPIGRVGIIGTSTPAIELAMSLLDADIPVTIFDSRRETLDTATALVRSSYRNSVLTGELSERASARRIALFAGTLLFHHLKDCDLIIETVFSDSVVREKLFRSIDEMAKPGAILALNALDSDVNCIAALTKRPRDVLGLFFGNSGTGFEVVRGKDTSAEAFATVTRLAKLVFTAAAGSRSRNRSIEDRMPRVYGLDDARLFEHDWDAWQIE